MKKPKLLISLEIDKNKIKKIYEKEKFLIDEIKEGDEFEFIDLNEYSEIKSFSIEREELEEIVISENSKLESISIQFSNKIEGLNNIYYFYNLIFKLEILNLSNNENLFFNLCEIKDLINLKSLFVNNTKCFGTLRSLLNLNKLRRLAVHNTNIIPSFEYLDIDCLVSLYDGALIKKEDLIQSLPINMFLINVKSTIKKSLWSSFNEYHLKIIDFLISHEELSKRSRLILKLDPEEYREVFDNLREALNMKKNKDGKYEWPKDKELITLEDGRKVDKNFFWSRKESTKNFILTDGTWNFLHLLLENNANIEKVRELEKHSNNYYLENIIDMKTKQL
ncbi:MAG: hypothetical protein AM1032_000127 [Mycoplasmataceae bacterium]|nr:MAG: hypothetical protein AM1032_000127 [Mycoplasmataceae bacterium]